MLVNTRELMEFYELRSTVSLQSTMSTNVAIEANLSPRLPTGKIPFLIFFVPQKLKNMLSLSLCYIVRYVIMDFNKFQQWCQNRGFVVKLPSGYSKLINFEVSSFESFKGIFNLCMLFFYEETNRIKNEEMKQCLKNLDKPPITLYSSDDEGVSTLERIYDHKVNKNKRVYSSEIKFENGSSITPLKEGNIVRSLRSNKYWGNIDPKYTDEDFEKAINYLLTPDTNGIVPMDKLLKDLENKEKYEIFKSKWCDLGKEDYLKELENCKSGD